MTDERAIAKAEAIISMTLKWKRVDRSGALLKTLFLTALEARNAGDNVTAAIKRHPELAKALKQHPDLRSILDTELETLFDFMEASDKYVDGEILLPVLH